MPTFSPADASPLLICAVTIILAAAGGLLPFSPIEPVLLLTAIARPALLVPVVALATVSQMSAKALLFLGSQKAQARLSDRKRRAIEVVRARLEGRRRLQILTVLVSAVSGLPPLYVVTLVCGALRLRLSDYLIAGTVGRAARFSALVMLPQLFAAQPVAAQESRTRAVMVAGSGPHTYVLLSGMVGGVAGFRRLEAGLNAQGHRVISIDPYYLSIDSADVSFESLARRVERVLAAHDVTDARVVGHAHGAGVMLRLAAMAPHRVSEMFFIDVGALPAQRSKVFSSSLRLVPVIARVPGGRAVIRDRFVRGLRQNSGRQEWLDDRTQRAYAEPMLDNIDRVVALAYRLSDAREPEPLASVIARIRIPATVILGGIPMESGPDCAEIEALAPLGPLLRVERIAGVGHFPHEETPADVVRFLTAAAWSVVSRRSGATR